MILTRIFVPRFFQLIKMSTNLIVYSNKKTLKSVIESVVHPKHYTVYEVTELMVKTSYWHKSCALVVASISNEDIVKVLEPYLEIGGKVLCIRDKTKSEMPSSPNWKNLTIEHHIWDDKEWLASEVGEALKLLSIHMSDGGAIEHEQKKLTELYFYGNIEQRNFLENLESTIGPVIRYDDAPAFRIQRFREVLRTEELGQSVIFSEVVTSTMDVADQIGNKFNGITVIAHVQLKGQGRSGNKWISPEGAALFTVKLVKQRRSILFSQLPLLQHAAALAVVMAVKGKDGYENIPLLVKWPNDVYIDGQKVGGILARSSIIYDLVSCSIGIGVNLDNRAPTVSLNQILAMRGMTPLDLEGFIAEVLNNLELIVEVLEKESLADFKELYYKHWMHSDSPIDILSQDGSRVGGRISGIDDHGYLLVRTEGGVLVAVHPDGNSFDIMEGLIAPKLKPVLDL